MKILHQSCGMNITQFNIKVSKIPEEKIQEPEEIFEEIDAKNFPKLMKQTTDPNRKGNARQDKYKQNIQTNKNVGISESNFGK